MAKKAQDKTVITVARIPGKRSPFHRSVPGDKGITKAVLAFQPDSPMELNREEFAAVKKDIGGSLCIVDEDKDRPGRFIVDWETTQKMYAENHPGFTFPNQERQRRSIGHSTTPPPSKNNGQVKPEPKKDGELALSDGAMSLIEKNAGRIGTLNPENVRLYLESGGELEGSTPALLSELQEVLGL